MAEDNIQDLCRSGPNPLNNKIDWIFKIIYVQDAFIYFASTISTIDELNYIALAKEKL
jgi:hypothetical protein